METLIKSLGEPIEGNEYILKPINGEWWIEHRHVGSGEPLKQWLELQQSPVNSLNTPTKQQIIKTLHQCAKIQKTDEGVKMERIFEKEAEAILKLLKK